MRWILLMVCLVVTPVFGEEAYRWVDEDGVLHFSDTPHPGAELIELGEVQTFSAPAAPAAPPPASGTSAAAEEETPADLYRTFKIVQPAPEQTIRDNSGTLDISLDVDPRIRTGHRLELFLDGQSVDGIPRATTRFTIDGVPRGAHTLRAELRDGSGNPVAESPTVRFYVMQTSIQNPANPLAPGNRPTPRPRPGG
ncbi:MAG: DUF4124 domain-containing protein [Gammaproteobacteria bacterium]